MSDPREGDLAGEGEAFAVKSIVNHFESLIRENENETILYSDSIPVVQAWKKMTMGKFSTSPRISTFLTTAC